MTTVREIVTAAYRKAAIVSLDEELEADQIAEAVGEFNRMVYAWKLRGVDTSHTAVGATDTFPLSDEYEEGCVYLLAQRISPNYIIPETFDADAWFREIQAAYADIPELTVPSALTRTPSREDRDGNLPLTY